MTVEKAIRLLGVEYARAKRLTYVRNPIAYALYQVWKMADSQSKNQESEVYGKWIYDEYGNPHCSKCEHVQDVPTNYCSECGTDMRGDQNE